MFQRGGGFRNPEGENDAIVTKAGRGHYCIVLIQTAGVSA